MRLGFLKWLLVSFAVVMLSACGGGGGSDVTAPIINIIGANPQIINRGTSYTALSATTDDGSIVVVDASNVDTGVVGIYTVTYNSTNASGGHATEMTRTVKVIQQVKKTGQVSSYNAAGTEVTNDSITPSYTRDGATDVVTSHITGLEWQADTAAKTVSKQWLTTVNYEDCRNNNNNCDNTTGDTAATYCSNLALDGGGWRLPTIGELTHIVDRSKRNPAINILYFKNVVSNYYWSSTTVVGDSYNAWSVRFYDGYDGWRNKSYGQDVRCVRDGQ